MLDKYKQMLSQVRLDGNKALMLLGAAGLIITAAIVFTLLRGNQGYTALFGSQENIPVSQVVEVLGGEAIPYRINPDNGQILVQEDKLAKARMALAGKGISALTPPGYELMDKDEMLGSSQFIQNVRYKRSMEGELAQSISALDPVASARVHLAMVESSSFVLSNRPQSSASVIVRLKYGQELNTDQVGAIVQLVAGSVPGMSADSVRVVDQNGDLLSAAYQAENSGVGNAKSGNDIAQRLRTETEKNISNLLTSVVGANNFRISVVPQLNLSNVEETQERYLGEPRINNEDLNQENTTDQMAMGIPGSLSNRPANAPAATNPQALSTRNQAQRKYAYDRDIRHVRYPGYQLEKMTVAIVLNQAAPLLADWTPQRNTELSKLMIDAAGLNLQRGDSLTMNMMNFSQTPAYEEPAIKWWQDPATHRWGEMGGIGLLALLFMLFGVRPFARRFSRSGMKDITPSPAMATGLTLEPDDADAGDEATLAQNMAKSSFHNDENLPPMSSGLEAKIEHMQMLSHSETDRVAEVLKQWINSNERSSSNTKQEQ